MNFNLLQTSDFMKYLLEQITLRIVGYHFSSQLTATLNLCLIYFKITLPLAIPFEHMQKNFEINRTKIKGGCQSGKKWYPTIIRVT